jgi:hypothetical protein
VWYETKAPLREIQERWAYEDVMKANAVLDMYSAVETAREAFDKLELEKIEREAKTKARR